MTRSKYGTFNAQPGSGFIVLSQWDPVLAASPGNKARQTGLGPAPAASMTTQEERLRPGLSIPGLAPAVPLTNAYSVVSAYELSKVGDAVGSGSAPRMSVAEAMAA